MAETVDGLQDVALTFSGRALDVDEIETQLGRLRFLAAGSPQGGDAYAPRASLLNMVVYAEREEKANSAGRIVEELASFHPSRALIVVARPSDDESHIEANLSAHCHMTRDAPRSVCCEEVTLEVSGRSARHLHSIIIPLLVPDLPVYVWWMEELPADPHLFLELLDTADRLFVDSGTFGDQLRGLQDLARLSGSEPRSTVGDLNWGRTETWRGIFEGQQNIKEMRHHFTSVEGVEIEYADGPQPNDAAQPILFLAWLAGQLGWDTSAVSSEDAGRFTFHVAEDRSVPAFVSGVPYDAAGAGSLVSVKIACRSETASAILSVARTGEPNHLTVRVEHKQHVKEESVRLEPCPTSAMLRRELTLGPHNRAYQQTLLAAAPLVAAART